MALLYCLSILILLIFFYKTTFKKPEQLVSQPQMTNDSTVDLIVFIVSNRPRNTGIIVWSYLINLVFYIRLFFHWLFWMLLFGHLSISLTCYRWNNQVGSVSCEIELIMSLCVYQTWAISISYFQKQLGLSSCITMWHLMLCFLLLQVEITLKDLNCGWENVFDRPLGRLVK